MLKVQCCVAVVRVCECAQSANCAWPRGEVCFLVGVLVGVLMLQWTEVTKEKRNLMVDF